VKKDALDVWSPLPPAASGIADYVEEQLETLAGAFDLRLCVEEPEQVDAALRERYRVSAQSESVGSALRLYHIGNSPAHAAIYREAIRSPGVVVLHEWNLQELLLSFAVKSNDFEEYKRTVRREHGEAGSVAGLTIASALGGRHWTSVFPLNAELLSRALGVVCLASSTAARAGAKAPGVPLLPLPHHALLRAHASTRTEARQRLGLDDDARVVLAPGLGTASKSLEVVRGAMATVRAGVKNTWLVTVGGGEEKSEHPRERAMGRVDLETLGDSLLAADVVLALRFPSRGETSGVLMRALAAGRAAVVTSGSTADEDLPAGVVARLAPGPGEVEELAGLLEFLLNDDAARARMERLALEIARTRAPGPLTERLADFVQRVSSDRARLESELHARLARGEGVRALIRDDLDRAALSLGLTHLPAGVFERLARL
jgi:glycosyltransferase involved in cell wall biosynthesis